MFAKFPILPPSQKSPNFFIGSLIISLLSLPSIFLFLWELLFFPCFRGTVFLGPFSLFFKPIASQLLSFRPKVAASPHSIAMTVSSSFSSTLQTLYFILHKCKSHSFWIHCGFWDLKFEAISNSFSLNEQWFYRWFMIELDQNFQSIIIILYTFNWQSLCN